MFLEHMKIKLEKKKFGMTKRRQVLKGFDDRGAGWNSVRQQMLYFAQFVINSLNKHSSLFKTVLILLQHFLLPYLQYELNSKN